MTAPPTSPLELAADALGRQALPAYALGLAALWVVATLVWLAVRRGWRAGAVPLPAPGALALRAGVGFALVLAAARLFAELAEGMRADAVLGRADQALTHAIAQTVPPAALQAFALVTHLADSATLAAACAGVGLLLWWRGHRAEAVAWVLAIGGNALLNTALKEVFARVRPEHTQALVAASGYSFPSGHSSGAVVMFGMGSCLLLRRLPPRWHLPLVLAAVGLAFTVACSRVFLQVHYASDVLAGLASGTAWLTVCLVSSALAQHYRQRRRAP